MIGEEILHCFDTVLCCCLVCVGRREEEGEEGMRGVRKEEGGRKGREGGNENIHGEFLLLKISTHK